MPRTSTSMRQGLNRNLVSNGDFEVAPTFVAATTSNAVFIDGTASGSSALRSAYIWFNRIFTGTMAASFDNTVSHAGSNSMKFVLTNARGEVMQDNGGGARQYLLIPALPSTSYTFTGWIKTSSVTGSGVSIYLREFSGTGGSSINEQPASQGYLLGDNNWTQLTLTMTTGVSTNSLSVGLRASAAGLTTSGTFWADDLILTPTVSPTRSTA